MIRTTDKDGNPILIDHGRIVPIGADIRVEDDGGSVVLLRGVTDEGHEWLAEHVSNDLGFGTAYGAERRFVQDIIDGAQADGLNVLVQD
jgi:hypothetical protein